MIVFEIFRRNGDCTFYVAVKIGGDSKKMMGLVAISFDKAFSSGLIVRRRTNFTILKRVWSANF
jgi:hypothetical protein